MLLSLVLPALLYGFFEAEISFCFFCSKALQGSGASGHVVDLLSVGCEFGCQVVGSSPLCWRSWRALEEKFVLPEKTPSPPSFKKNVPGSSQLRGTTCMWKEIVEHGFGSHQKTKDRLSFKPGHRTNEALHNPTPPGSVHGLHVIRNNIKRHCFQHHTHNHHWVKKKKIASSDTSEDCERLGRASFRDNSPSLTLNLDVPTVGRSHRIKLTMEA